MYVDLYVFWVKKSEYGTNIAVRTLKGHLVTFGTLHMTFSTLNMTFKGHKYLKFRNLASFMSISMFFGPRNPNTVPKLPYALSKVTHVTFGTINMTFKGHIYLKSRNLASCMLISMYLKMTFKGHILKSGNLATCSVKKRMRYENNYMHVQRSSWRF